MIGGLAVLWVFNACYSFKGASLASELKTIQISNIKMEAAGGPTNLSLEANEKLKEYFQRNTSLKLSTINPDLLLEGTILGYELSPQAPTSDDKAGINRLTLRIQFRLTNRLDESKNFEQEFSFYQDFPQNQTLSQVEKSLIPKLLDQIILDLFNKMAGDW
ncbi:MAG: hypothetical protein RI995_2122 [Bacteroidota bacterium]|jgi:hypothetical protein